ncbi:MAG: phosphoribosylglycinamide formyltransferase [Herpetosiphonaceae bacterium]|nr:phosphoribosylglycinamide formyltransferase [Herpetosiphonaceae bacterium]
MTDAAFRVVVLVSGSGSNLQALLDDQTGYEVVAVVADRSKAAGIERGLRANVATVCLPLRHPKDSEARHAWEEVVARVIAAFAPDLVVMAGWMRVMSSRFVAQFADRMINQHPALLPSDGAATMPLSDGQVIPVIRGAHAVRDALMLGLPVTGCTIHRVTEEVDVGPILAQVRVPILPDDTEASLHERIKQVERPLIVQIVRELAQGSPAP